MSFRAKSRLVAKPKGAPKNAAQLGGIGKTEASRRLGGLGLSHRDDPDVQAMALAIVERFRKWTDRCGCIVTGLHTGQYLTAKGIPGIPDGLYQVVVHWAHVLRTRGAWSWDFGATLPLVDLYHRIEERTPDFFALRDMSAEQLAHDHAVKFFKEHPKDARWVVLSAMDADAVRLAEEGLEA